MVFICPFFADIALCLFFIYISAPKPRLAGFIIPADWRTS